MKKRTILALAILVAVTLVACQLSSLVPTAASPTLPLSPTMTLPTASTNLSGDENLLAAIYTQASPSVVTIRAYSANGTGSLGSGWVYSSEGYIVTNNHVIEGATQVEVDFVSGLKVYGTLVGADAHSDLAVIKVDAPASDLRPLALGNSDTLQIGQTVVAIGNPFGLNGTMTTGIVSALGRAIASNVQASGGGYFSEGDIIQTDAALNPGNSGGPLLNLDGEVVGVNAAINTTGYTATGEPVNSGIGFAISINIVKRVIPSLITNGKFDYPYLGISSVDDLTLADIEALGLKSYTGVYVTSLVAGGPADQAGVHAGSQTISTSSYPSGGDLIIAADGQTVLNYDNLMSYLILNKSPGDKIVLTVLRGDQKVDLTLTLAARP
jgi:S1-C subfamily serine protease